MKTAVNKFIDNFQSANRGKIVSHKVENDVVKAGDNMLSGIIRLKYTYKKWFINWTGSVILKIPSLAPLPYAELKKTNMFDREIHFYATLLPQLYQLGKCKPFAPQLYAYTEATALVLEDLSQEGYKPGNRITQLDISHSRISLELLAKYHALSYKYLQNLDDNDQSISLIHSYQPTLIGRPRKEAFTNFCKLVELHLSEQLNQKIMNSEDEILANPITMAKPSEDYFAVIIHADFRTNNILFKYGWLGGVKYAKLIDWQLSREGSPTLDLIYFFVTSISIGNIEANYDALVNLYLNELNKELSKLKVGREYSRLEFDGDIAYYKYYFLNIVCIVWQQIMRAGPPGEETDAYVSNSVKWLNYLEQKGFI